MNTTVWGPGAWLFLESLCFNYPEHPNDSDKARYYNFLGDLMPNILCCRYCRISTVQFVDELPIEHYLDNRQALVVWIYLLHDKVNRKLSKQSISFREFVHRYEKIRAKCSKEKKGCVISSPQKMSSEIDAWADLAYAKYGTRLFLLSKVRNKTKIQLLLLYIICLVLIIFVIVKN